MSRYTITVTRDGRSGPNVVIGYDPRQRTPSCKLPRRDRRQSRFRPTDRGRPASGTTEALGR